MFVIFPVASGVPAVGRTWIFEKVAWHSVEVLLSLPVMVKVIEPDAGVAVFDKKVKHVPLPDVLVIVAVTVVPVLYENPEGAVSTIVPLPVDIARPLVSVMVGPVSVVHVAVPFVVFVSALMVLPPVAAVTVTAAKALCAPTKNNAAAKAAKVITLKICPGTLFFM